jgi:indolepyruvate ferredoxin oxidoreductase beta subunit
MRKGVRNILMVGVGGQGIILASDILTLAAMLAGHDAKKSEIHGMSQRGGSVFSHIRYGEKVHSPTIAEGAADILLSLEEMETLRWLNYAGTHSVVITLQTRIKPAMVNQYPEGLEEELRRRCGSLTYIEPEQLKGKIENIKYFNVALLGVLAVLLDLPEESWRAAIEERVPKGSFEGNWKAFQAGKRFACK